MIYVDGQFPLLCDLVDMSQAGARVSLACSFGVPQAFTLVFGPGSVSRDCVVVWRSGLELGAHFLRSRLTRAQTQTPPACASGVCILKC